MSKKAVALLSGGLDSTLAIKVLLEQGIEVVALNFLTPFCCCSSFKTGCSHVAVTVSKQFKIEVKFVHLGQEYLEVVKSPKHGYGKNLNPCIDCRILMLKKAKEFMKESGASFIVTGEVLGQRPMSQHRRALETIEKESGLAGLILRPLSAKMLPPTIIEQKGWVDRDSLLDISGRTRKPQIKLAGLFGVKDYSCPAGGCLLTDKLYASRLKDLIKHKDFNMHNVNLLRTGRYFRINPSLILFVGRNEQENNRLIVLAKESDTIFEPVSLAGPTAIGRGELDGNTKILCAQIIARYTSKGEKVEVQIITNNQKEVLTVDNIAQNVFEQLIV